MKITKLQVLNLTKNIEIDGELPASFYNLTSLEDFSILYTKVGGEISKAIAGLKNLRDFYVQNCEFSGTIPEEFGLLSNLRYYDFNGNYYTVVPQFPRYIGVEKKTAWHMWGDWPCSSTYCYAQRDIKSGRPEGFITKEDGFYKYDDILVDGQPLKWHTYYAHGEFRHYVSFPMWARVKHGFCAWGSYFEEEIKDPEYPQSDDLQYPADEYYWDGKNWRHPKLEYPAREYWYDNGQWLHDASCPWEQEYIDPRINR